MSYSYKSNGDAGAQPLPKETVINMIATRIAPIEATLTEYGRTDESREILGALQFLTSDPAHMELGVVPTDAVKSVIETINRVVSESTTVVDTRGSEYVGHRNGPAGCVYYGTVSLRNRIDLSEEFVEYKALMRALGVGSNTDELISGYFNENRINSSPAFSPAYWFLTAVSMYEDNLCGNISCYSEYTESHVPFVVIHDNTETSEPGARIINISVETGEADWVKYDDDEIDPADFGFESDDEESVDEESVDEESVDEESDDEESDDEESVDDDYIALTEDDRCCECGNMVRRNDGEWGVAIGHDYGHVDCMIGSKK